MIRRFLRAIIAVLAGNAIYFAALHYLPVPLQHQPFRFDLGLVVDFLLCVLLWFALAPVLGMNRKEREERKGE